MLGLNFVIIISNLSNEWVERMMTVGHARRRIQVQQKIRYFPEGQEDFSYQAEADHFSLETYDKLVFQDFNQADLQLKWWPQGHNFYGRLELTQAAGRLLFDMNQRTHNAYQSPQGSWDLELETDKLEIGSDIQVQYRLYLAGQCLGSYEFQLIFID